MRGRDHKGRQEPEKRVTKEKVGKVLNVSIYTDFEDLRHRGDQNCGYRGEV